MGAEKTTSPEPETQTDELDEKELGEVAGGAGAPPPRAGPSGPGG
jgi:hypothetical protein